MSSTATMSWKALDWATESDIRSPTTKFVLHLLANKADEDFSCYPSIHTLMTESGAGRNTVMRALKELEATGFITRRPQFHDSGAQRSTRYYLNHPQAPHLAARPALGPPRPDVGPPGPNRDGPRITAGRGTVPERDPTGGPKSGPLEPPIRTTNRTSSRCHECARRFTRSLEGWPSGCRNPDTCHPSRASVGLDPRKPHPTHFTQPRWRPKPRTGPSSTPSRPTPRAHTDLPANHRVVRPMRRRKITHHHHRHARRHRSSRVLPPLQPTGPKKIKTIQRGGESNWRTMCLTNFRCYSRCPEPRSYWESAAPPPTASSHQASCPSVDSAVAST